MSENDFVLFIYLLCGYFKIWQIVVMNSEQTRVLLTSAAYVHLKHAEVSKFTRNLSPASRAILLSGPAGLISLPIFSDFNYVM